MILILLTSSRIDSIRASQHLVDYKIVLLIINVKENVTDQRPSNKVLKLANILSSRTLSALDNIETDTITLGQRFKTFSLDGGMMHEKVLAALLLDKTKSL